MNTFLLILWLVTCVALAIFYFLKQRADKATLAAQQQAATAEQESQRVITQVRAEAQEEMTRARNETQAAVAQANRNSQEAVNAAQIALHEKLAEVAQESERLRKHYEGESLRIYQQSAQQLDAMFAELAPLRGYASLQDAENEVRQTLTEAISEATNLRREADTLLEQTKTTVAQTRLAAQQRTKDIRSQADAILNQATRDASRMTETAEQRAQQIGGEAYTALRDKEVLEQAVAAMWNTVDGYGDRYVVPTHSVLDELAADFGHTQAGEELRAARDQSRRMVEMKVAATSKYEEVDRRERANRFVVDAFNGRVDAILGRTKHDNYGTLQQEIRDAFSLVNSNGLVFHEARILPAYLDARLAELKWAVAAQELKRKEREEQRELQEQIREEEKARREYQRAVQEAAREEELIRRAMAKARAEAENASAAERAALEGQMSGMEIAQVQGVVGGAIRQFRDEILALFPEKAQQIERLGLPPPRFQAGEQVRSKLLGSPRLRGWLGIDCLRSPFLNIHDRQLGRDDYLSSGHSSQRQQPAGLHPDRAGPPPGKRADCRLLCGPICDGLKLRILAFTVWCA